MTNRILEGHGAIHDREISGKRRNHVVRIAPNGADQGNGGDMCFVRKLGHAKTDFSANRLTVDLAFTGETEIGALESGGEPHSLGDKLAPALKPGSAKGEEGRTETARGAGSRGIFNVRAKLVADDLCIELQILIKDFHHIRRSAFLRPEDPCGAFRSGERIIDIGGDEDLGFGNAPIKSGHVDSAEFFDSSSA